MICLDTETRCVVTTHTPPTTCDSDGWARAIRDDVLLNTAAWPFDDGDRLVGRGWTLNDEALDLDLDLDDADALDLDEFGPGWTEWVDPDAEARANFYRDITPRGGWR